MSAMANTTPIVTTVTKPTTKEKTPREADATPRVNIQDFCEEHYEDILPVIMDKIRRDKRKEVHARENVLIRYNLGGEEKVNLHYPAYRRAALAMKDTRSPIQKGIDLWMKMTWRYLGYVNRWDKDLQRKLLSGYTSRQQKKYIKGPVENNNIKQRAGEAFKEFRE
ncbi:hypothetical protein Tco_1184933 [Tanacetum coccineum]